MKAIFFEQHGGPEVLRFADLSDPQPKTGQALIKVKAVALNHLDIWVRRGWKGLHLEMPHITGSDIAGEIVSVNAESNWTPGTRVVINPGINTAEDEWTRSGEESVSPGYRIIGEQIRGGLAQYICVPIENVFKLPEHVSFEQGCAPLLVGTTCWRMLFDRGKLQAGDSVLVVGAGGGVNALSIQLAKRAGAQVFALAGGNDKKERALELGADYVVDYKANTNWPVEILKLSKGRGVDLVIDNVGRATIEKSIRSVARGGRIVTVGNTSGPEFTFDNRMLFTKQVSIIGSTMGSKQDFIDVTEFMWTNNIVPAIDRIAPLEDGISMLQRLEKGDQFGKIILVP
ncbi:MAG: zinc-binding dehydrogenase [Bdellovibrionales bacterium]|nr:zinc-binding dehydrogenase [Bdellovibrionales bacterium]